MQRTRRKRSLYLQWLVRAADCRRYAATTMEHLEYPSKQLWEERRHWFEALEEESRGEGNYLVSEQACALIAEVQSVFCAGAWVAVVILVLSIIDAQLR